MVFESIVVDLLNRVLGSYFENLDTSQLKLGIWGGDAVLKDLVLKTSAMDDLGLPFKVVIGKLGNLTMRIPWQSLYTAPVELDLKNLYLLLVPSYTVKYNEESEEAAAQAKKQAEINRIDELRKNEQLKKSGAQEEAPQDSFSEKLITQIIKNIQIKIESIHIRYEDNVTIPHSPFAFGTILKNLTVQTTDENWKLAVITETVNIIHKMAKLEGLSLYWNSKTDVIISKIGEKNEMLKKLQEFVDNSHNMTYVLGPISSDGKIKLVPSPERLKFSHSKFVIDVDMKELAVGLTNRQFQDAMSLAEAIDFMSRAQHYRKYRPNVITHKGHYKEWWKFAYRCIIEEDVRRRQLNWDWHHIKQHRELVKVYADVYYKKLTMTNANKKHKTEIDAKVAQCEKALDVFNITLVRKQVEVKVERAALKHVAEVKPATGWFSGWFGSSAPDPHSTNAASTTGGKMDIAKKLEEALTVEEKSKLYAAIDYKEGAGPIEYPHAYLDYVLNFTLHRLKCTVRDGGNIKWGERTILDLVVANVSNSVATRPYKSGFLLNLKMGSVEGTGMKKSSDTTGISPHLISSKSTGVESELFVASFETNPLDSNASQKIVFNSSPVEIVYHSKTIIELVKCFTLPPDVQLTKLQAATFATINEWREQSAAGLQHLIETRGELDINVHFVAPYLLIPQTGNLDKGGSVLIFDLGEIKVRSKARDKGSLDKASQAKKTKEEIRQEILDKSYDSFLVTLKDFQVLFALSGENYRSAIGKTLASTSLKKEPKNAKIDLKNDLKTELTEMELIKSEELVVQLDQSIVSDDPSLPKIKLSATLPLIDFVISESRFLELLTLLVTLPLPESGGKDGADDLSRNPGVSESVALSRIAFSDLNPNSADRKGVQLTELLMFFSISAIRIRINRTQGPKKLISPLAHLDLVNLQSRLTQKTFSLGFDVSLGGLSLTTLTHSAPDLKSGEPLALLKTPMSRSENLFKLTFFSISSDCPPVFVTPIKQSLDANVSTLDVILHQEALRTLINFTSKVLDSAQKTLKTVENIESSSTLIQSTAEKNKKEEKKQLSKFEATRKAVIKKHQNPSDTLLQVTAKLDRLTVQLSTENKNILKLIIGKLDLGFRQMPKESHMSMKLSEFEVLNLDKIGLYKKIIYQEQEEKVVYIQCTLYDEATKGEGQNDTSKYDLRLKVETGSPRIVYLSPFIDELMNFVNNFQTAKAAVLDASSAAVEVATEKVGEAYSVGTRALIDIQLKSPLIIIPRNSSSSAALLAYLGTLSIKNSFKKLKDSEEEERRVIVDEIGILLQDMKLNRTIFKDQKIYVECSLLDPVTLRLSIQRNLSDWYKNIPSIYVKGDMASTSIRCSGEDYAVIMACLAENISAKSNASVEASSTKAIISPPTPHKNEIKTEAIVNRMRGSFREKRASVDSKAAKIEESIRVYTNIKVELAVHQANLVLYEGSSNLEGKQGLVERSKKSAFAKFAISEIGFSLIIYTNTNMSCQIGISNVSLEDVRPGEREITSLIHRKSNEEGGKKALIVISYETDAKLGNTANIQITGMTFVLCLEYLMQLASFFTSSSGPSGQTLQKALPDGQGGQGVKEEVVESSPIFKVYFSMGETDVLLVETVEHSDTNALVLNCEIDARSIIEDGKSNTMAAVNRVRLSTCKYEASEREKSLAEVISPMSITLVMNSSQAGGTLIDINISDIYIRLTAGTIELFLKIMSSFQSGVGSGSEAEIRPDFTDIWAQKNNDEGDFWFLLPQNSVELGVDALALSSIENPMKFFDRAEELVRTERLILESGSIVITFETGIGSSTFPVLLLETDMDAQVFDWSTNLQMTGRLKMEIAYYNAIYGMWEFIVEPVETRSHGKVSHRPWELYFEYNTVECTNMPDKIETKGSPSSPEEEPESDEKNPTFMSISLQSSDILEVTITKESLEVLNILASDFQEASKSLVSQKLIITSPYSLRNFLGVPIQLELDENSPFIPVHNETYRKSVLNETPRQSERQSENWNVLESGKSMDLALRSSRDKTKKQNSVLKEQEGKEERLLRVIVDSYDFETDIPVNRAEKRYYNLDEESKWGDKKAIICDTSVVGTSKVVTFRSITQIVNHMKTPISIFMYSEGEGKVVEVGVAEKEAPFSVPLSCLYSKNSDIFFSPKGYKLSNSSCNWLSILKLRDGEKIEMSVICPSQDSTSTNFHIKVVGETKEALFEGTNRKNESSFCVYIHLKSPLIVNNMLPLPLSISLLPSSPPIKKADKGHSVEVTDVLVGPNLNISITLIIPSYENQEWKCVLEVDKSTPDLSAVLFQSSSNRNNTIYLGIHKDLSNENMTLLLYSPFWMVNRTGLTLAYHTEDKKEGAMVVHREDSNPMLFSFGSGKSFFSKKKGVVRVEGESDWSTKFPLDVAGSSGSVTCKSPTRDYEIGIEIVLTGWGLTKSIIFTPRYYLVNQCSYVLEVTESEKLESKLKIPPSKCVPFWPKSSTPHLLLRIDNTNEFSKVFTYEKSDEILIQLHNKYGGVHVDVHITEGSHVLTFTEFVKSHAAVLLINHNLTHGIEVCDKDIETSKRCIEPGRHELITWYDPMKEKVITWSPVGSTLSFQDYLNSDAIGNYKYVDGCESHWVSFLDGLQRVLLFSTDANLVRNLHAAKNVEAPTGEYYLLLHGLGLSLVDTGNRQEIMYTRIASSEIGWESKKTGKYQRFKPIPYKNSSIIEYAYQNYLNEKIINTNPKSHLTLDAGIEVDFIEMKMIRPYERSIRRVFQTGLWAHYKTFPHTYLIHAKLNRLQIDNQIPDGIFATVLAPVKPPKSVSNEDLPKPFAEVSIMERMVEHSSVLQYKYFKVLIQEFHIKLDISFVNAVVGLFSEDAEKKLERMVEYFDKDYEEVSTDFDVFLDRRVVSQGQKNFYDYLHFSPLKIHLSFSMGGATQLSNSFLNLLIASLGVSVTEIQDVTFKLACMELQRLFLTREQLIDEAYAHYSSQALRQLYVLVLGLDVIGNPYGLIVGFTQGVGAFFYEPVQGAIQGPGEFMEGVALGVKSLFGHTIGGMSGAMSKIAGTFGKGVAALTLDDDYQRKRRENLSRRQTPGDGFVESGKDLVMGFVDGFTGVFTQPVKGAKKEGVEGFFKGLGKGAIGLITRPAAGMIDFTSGSFDAVKKATSVSDETRRMRPPRYIAPNSVLQPYVLHEAEGIKLLNELEKGKYGGGNESYIAHALINPHGLYVLLLTNKRILYLKKLDLFGGWNTQWMSLWEDLDGVPILVEKGLAFRLKASAKRSTNIFKCQSKLNDFVVPLYSPDVCALRNTPYFIQWLLSKIETAMRTETGVGPLEKNSETSTEIQPLLHH